LGNKKSPHNVENPTKHVYLSQCRVGLVVHLEVKKTKIDQTSYFDLTFRFADFIFVRELKQPITFKYPSNC